MNRARWSRHLLAPLLGVAVVLAVPAWLMGCARDTSQPRLVLLYAPCSVSRLFLSPYDPSVTYTPFLKAFAEDGLVFTKHHTEAGISGVGYAALFSGNQVMRHGVYAHPTRLPDSLYLIAEAYRDNGYDTFFWADHGMASPEFNYAQGMDHVMWRPHGVGPHPPGFLRAEDPRFHQVLARLRDDPAYKAFIITNFAVTHVPYRDQHVDEFCRDVPRECANLTAAEIDQYKELIYSPSFAQLQLEFDSTVSALKLSRADVAKLTQVAQLLYESNIHHLDRLFGGVIGQIEAAGLLDESLIAFTADHGEVVRQRKSPFRWTHGYMLSNEDIVVPLILRGPGVPAGRYGSVTRSIDVFPTLAGLSGVKIPAGTVSGMNLAPAIRGEEEAPKLLAFSHTGLVPKEMKVAFLPFARIFPADGPASMWVSVREGDLVFKITSDESGTFRAHVYDWEADPSETKDLFDPHDAHQMSMMQRLNGYKNEIIGAYDSSQGIAGARALTERQKELLRALGYLSDNPAKR